MAQASKESRYSVQKAMSAQPIGAGDTCASSASGTVQDLIETLDYSKRNKSHTVPVAPVEAAPMEDDLPFISLARRATRPSEHQAETPASLVFANESVLESVPSNLPLSPHAPVQLVPPQPEDDTNAVWTDFMETPQIQQMLENDFTTGFPVPVEFNELVSWHSGIYVRGRIVFAGQSYAIEVPLAEISIDSNSRVTPGIPEFPKDHSSESAPAEIAVTPVTKRLRIMKEMADGSPIAIEDSQFQENVWAAPETT